MILQAALPPTATLIGIVVFTLLLVVAFSVAHAKRDVEINITLLEFHR